MWPRATCFYKPSYKGENGFPPPHSLELELPLVASNNPSASPGQPVRAAVVTDGK